MAKAHPDLSCSCQDIAKKNYFVLNNHLLADSLDYLHLGWSLDHIDIGKHGDHQRTIPVAGFVQIGQLVSIKNIFLHIFLFIINMPYFHN